jgi:hypothetical protein
MNIHILADFRCQVNEMRDFPGISSASGNPVLVYGGIGVWGNGEMGKWSIGALGDTLLAMSVIT